MAVNLGPDFEAALIALAGWNPADIDPASTDIALVNPSGKTTVRATIVAQVDTATLSVLIKNHV
jgi:hypothetical protein